MMNTEAEQTQADEDAAVHAIMRRGAPGAIMLAGLATAVVVALWLAFYFLVFVPRAMTP
jgi:hypothetical protein